MNKLYILIIILFTSFQNIDAQVEVITGLNQVGRMTLNGNDLYFSNFRKISKIDISESTPTVTDVIIELDEPNSFTTIFYGNDLYFSQTIGDKISKIDITDSIPSIEDVVIDIDFPADFLLIGDDLYFCQPGLGKISRIDLTDSIAVVVDVVTGLGLPNGMALNGNDLYIAELTADKISKIDITQKVPILMDVVTGVDGPISLALNNNDLYIVEIHGDKISKIDITDAVPTIVDVITNLNEPVDLVFYNSDLYYSEGEGGKISKLENVILSINEFQSDAKVSLYPNPSSYSVQISGLIKTVNYKIYSTTGAQVLAGTLSENEQINIESLANNMYFIVFENGIITKFIKE